MNLRTFRSVKFNIGLFLVIVFASTLGMLLPQLSDAPEKVDLFLRAHPFWGKIFQSWGFFHLYESWWFISLLTLMAFDIMVCKLGKTPPDAGLVSLPPESQEDKVKETLSTMEAAIRQKPLIAEFTVAATPERVLAGLERVATQGKYHLHPLLGNARERWALIATRHRLQRWGSYVAHVALVVILSGGLIKALFGFVEMEPVLEGHSRGIQHRPGWELFVDKFTVAYYDGTLNPKLFSSRIRVEDHSKLLAEKLITVNDPLDVLGTRFYQASWGAGGMFRNVTLKMGDAEMKLPQHRPMDIPGTPIRVTADVLMPNFQVSSDGRADTGSLDLKNPAVRFYFDLKKRGGRALWLFQFNPDVALAEDEEGVLHHVPSPPFQLAAVDPILFSGIQVAYDPGFPLVAVGSVAWLVGMVLLFYMHRRRLWVLAYPTAEGSGGTRVLVGAWNSRSVLEYQKEFDALTADLRDAFADAANEKGGAGRPSAVPVAGAGIPSTGVEES